MLTALIIVLLSLSKNAEASPTSTYNNSNSSAIEESVATTQLSSEDQIINTNSINFKRWLEHEVKNQIDQYYIDSEKYNLEIELKVNKEGNVVDYKIGKTDNIELLNLLNNILKDAPSFEPVKMNGYAARMCYKVQISITVR
jgi:hypothetical protein